MTRQFVLESKLRKTLQNGKFGTVDPVVSDRMRAIVSNGNKKEKILRKIIKDILPQDYKVEYNANLPGKPDILIPELKLVMFCDGCFFHSCPKHGHIPKKNSDYWTKKFELNRKRALRIDYRLRKNNFHIWHIWEHDMIHDIARINLYNKLEKRFRKLSDQ